MLIPYLLATASVPELATAPDLFVIFAFLCLSIIGICPAKCIAHVIANVAELQVVRVNA